MNAALEKNQKRIEYDWDGCNGRVRMRMYDYAKTNHYRSCETKIIGIARQHWQEHVKMGFTKVITSQANK